MTSLSDVISSCNRYLLQAFDLPCPTADIRVHPDEVFKQEQSHYEPKSNIVNVPQTVDVARFIHEFYGHGLFHAHSGIGSRLSSIENKIDGFEKTFGIPKNARMLVRSSNCAPRIEQAPKDSDYDVTLFYSPEDKGTKAYLDLKIGYQNIFHGTREIQEGFALWMESVLLQDIGLNASIERRRQEITGTWYEKAFSNFAGEVKRIGVFSSFYKLGFPKSTRDDILVRFANEHLKSFEGLKFLIFYGSGKRDIDLLAVYEDERRLQKRFIYDGDVDLHILGQQEFFGRIQKHDIELLEPVLGGKFLFGDKEGFNDLKSAIKRSRPGEQAVRYHNHRALETFRTAETYLGRHAQDTIKKMREGGVDIRQVTEATLPENPTRDLSYAVNSLAFSLSYLISSEMFSLEGTILSHKEMLECDPLLREVTGYLKDVENGRALPSRKAVLGYCEKVALRLTSS